MRDGGKSRGAATAGGQQYSAPPPGGPVYGATPQQGLGMDENLAAALCYIPIIGLIFLLIDPYKNNRNIRFHALQSLFYTAACIVVSVGLGIVLMILRLALPYGVGILFSMMGWLVNLAFFAGWIIMVVKAFQGSRFVMPIIGPLAEKQL